MHQPRFRGARIIVTLALCIAMVPVAAGGASTSTSAGPRGVEGIDYASGRVILRFDGAVTAARAARMHSSAGAREARDIPGMAGLVVVELESGVRVADAILAYSQQPGVISAEPSYRVRLTGVPNDPLFNELWGLHNTSQEGGITDADIDAPEAWDSQIGTETVVVGVIDSGIDYTHPDLAANVWTNPGEIPSNGIDDDDNGYVDDVHGIDTANDDTDPMDDHGHGTHVSGTIAAVGDNGVGVVGVAYGAKVMALKAFDISGYGWQDDGIECMAYAKMMGARVINASYGSISAVDAEAAAIAAFGGTFCAAAGNSGTNNDAFPMYPASYALDNILSVAASTRFDGRAPFSSFGSQSVDLAAPGMDVTSTVMGGGYGVMSGTSMATPHASGVAALVLSKTSALEGWQVCELLRKSVDVLDSLEGDVVTSGRLNAQSAVLLDPDFDPPVVTDDHLESYLETAAVSIVATDTESGITELHYQRDGGFPVTLNSDAVTLTDFALGYHEITYWAKDNWSNESTPVTIGFLVEADPNPPTATDDACSEYGGSATIHITATDDMGVASITTRLDDESAVRTAGSAATIETSAMGDHELTYYATDVNGNRSGEVTVEFEVIPPLGDVPTEIAGLDRYETAVAASRAAFPFGADSVVIAAGAGWPDALSASALAGSMHGPLLLTEKNVVPPSVLLEIQRLGAKHALIVGGTGVISVDVQGRLRQMLGLEAVERLAGLDRYQTAQAVADRIIAHEGEDFAGTALVATGSGFADSLAAAPLATAFKWPLLLASDSGTLYVPFNVKRVIIVGGTGAVRQTVEEALIADLGAANVSRIAGVDRYQTGARIATYGVSRGLHWDGLCVATGEDYPDGLTGGSLAGRIATPLLLTTPATLAPVSAVVLNEYNEEISKVRFIGGTAAVSQAVRAAALQLIQ